MAPDVRWQQRFANFCQALEQLETFFQPPALNERERQGLIKAFEYCFELGWNTLRDLLLEGRSTAEQVCQQVGSRYLPCFQELRQVLSERIKATKGEGSDG
jgi:hypothetical protein